MQPTTITTMLLITFGVGLITMTIRLYFGSWEPRAPRRAPSHSYDDPEIEAAVLEMRQQIEDYERHHGRP